MRKGLLCVLGAVALAAADEIPAGTQIQVRLTAALSSATAKMKDNVETVVIAPVLAGNGIAIAAGTRIAGVVTEVAQPVKADDRAVLALQFDRIKAPGGAETALAAKLVAVDNARETVDEKGRILGIVAAQTGSARLDQGINKIAQRYPGLAEILGSAKQAVVKEADPSIAYDANGEMTIELTKPLRWEHPAQAPGPEAIEPAAKLAAIVNAQPWRTVAESPPRPSDITNVLFIGSEEQLEKAFQAAGWTSAGRLDSQSKLETFRALTEMRGYKEAPVSTLLLDGAPPSLVFQKQNNTFAMRHHLRIWRRPGKFNGRDIWVCAATHDIGIELSERDYTFIHRVDAHIDDERAKVVNDLLFTGQVKALALVERPDTLKQGENATDDAFETDGRMAVVEF